MNTSTSSLIPSQSRQSSPKNYGASFARLSSLYGFGGTVPSLPQKTKKSTQSSPQTPKTLPEATKPSQSPSQTLPKKDYESAFGQLSSSYGFGGGYPSLSTRH